MSENYKYFTVPFACVPSSPTYHVWFASWSAAQSEYTWSDQRPTAATWVCCATEGDDHLPPDATVIIPQTVKCVPPPPLALAQTITSAGDFQAVLTKNLNQYLIDIRSL
jgi:hypothetical protein